MKTAKNLMIVAVLGLASISASTVKAQAQATQPQTRAQAAHPAKATQAQKRVQAAHPMHPVQAPANQANRRTAMAHPAGRHVMPTAHPGKEMPKPSHPVNASRRHAMPQVARTMKKTERRKPVHAAVARKPAHPAVAAGHTPLPPKPAVAPAAQPAAVASEPVISRRDPFAPLIQVSAGGRETGEHLPPGIGGLVVSTVRVDGTVQSPSGVLAVVSNPDDRVYFVREGDRLYDGDVEKISLDGVTFKENSKDAFGKPVERLVTKRIYPNAGE
jgi:hypothetical protein